jgi:ankyrin repeat protein
MDLKRRTALMMAAASGNAELVALFLELGANSTLQDAGGQTALDLAQRQNQKEIVQLLQEHARRISRSTAEQ